MHGHKARAAVELARQNLRPEEIAARIGSTPGAVRAYLSRARQTDATIPRWSRGRTGMRIHLPEDVQAPLANEAAARRVSVEQLAATLLTIIATDGLYEAVLGPVSNARPLLDDGSPCDAELMVAGSFASTE